MSRLLCLVSLYSLLLCSDVSGQTYEAHTPPTIDAIEHHTYEIAPEGTERTNIGIGERVFLSLDESTWSDKDKKNDSTETIVDDTPKAPDWSVGSGPGEFGKISPTSGWDVVYTAAIKSTAYTAAVVAKIDDSSLGDDAPIFKTVNFAVKRPKGCKAIGVYADNLLGGSDGPPNERMGHFTQITVQILPNDVNFSKVKFRENIPAHNLDGNWPDLSLEFKPLDQPEFNVNNDLFSPNLAVDNCLSPYRAISKLIPDGGGAPQAVTFEIDVPLEFKAGDKASDWTYFGTNTHHRIFNADGSSNAKLTGTDGSSATGATQGPFKN